VSAEVSFETSFIASAKARHGNLVGVNPDYFHIQNLGVATGNAFGEEHALLTKPVCVIGAGVKSYFFPNSDPVGQYIKCGKSWFKVIGVLESKDINSSSMESLHLSDFNNQVYAPLETVLVRHKNRALVTQKSVDENNSGNDMMGGGTSDNPAQNKPNYNQLDRITVQIKDTRYLQNSAEVVTRLLKRRHSEVSDFDVQVPELLLKQKANTQARLQFLLACIAAISLVVGGIGIMNIMLATVMERIKEIGIRLSVGATKKDIVIQFMSESIFLSVTGGILGVLLGIALALIIPLFMEQTPTVVSVFSIIISFLVSACVGIIFGFVPAKRAAELDPILSLRHD
jgi:putative ABC transport system permease protein